MTTIDVEGGIYRATCKLSRVYLQRIGRDGDDICIGIVSPTIALDRTRIARMRRSTITIPFVTRDNMTSFHIVFDVPNFCKVRIVFIPPIGRQIEHVVRESTIGSFVVGDRLDSIPRYEGAAIKAVLEDMNPPTVVCQLPSSWNPPMN